jgi:glutamyl-tRNA reductase
MVAVPWTWRPCRNLLPMPILSLGVSHRRAPVELLERLAVPDEELPKAYRRLADAPEIAEAVILSTCNRVEVHAEVAAYHSGFLGIKRFLSEHSGLDPDDFAEPLYAHYEDQAAEHLFAVAAGLDSMVLGEPQILSQVRRAFRLAQEEGAAGPAMGTLFRAAVRAGRRVRSETAIGAAPEEMVTAGLRLAEEAVGPLTGGVATVVGAGGMATLAVQVLRRRGVERIRIANRSPERARTLAERHGGEAHALDALQRAIAGADVVVACTGAAGLVVAAGDVAGAMGLEGRGADRPRFLLDLAVPRDIDPAAAELPGVHLADVDDLAAAIDRAATTRSVAAARAVVADEAARFSARRRAARLAPLIAALRERGDRARDAEVTRALARMPDLSPQERATIQAMARAIVAKLLHEPVVRVKDLAARGAAEPHARALAELFGLDLPAEP